MRVLVKASWGGGGARGVVGGVMGVEEVGFCEVVEADACERGAGEGEEDLGVRGSGR